MGFGAGTAFDNMGVSVRKAEMPINLKIFPIAPTREA